MSGLFLAVVGTLVFAISLYGPAYTRNYLHGKNRQSLIVLGLFTALFILGMYLVVLADDAFLFMIAWELMSVASYFLVAYQHQHAANRRAAFLYLLMAHVAGVAILLGFGVLAGFGGGFTFEKMRAAELSTTWASIAFALAFFGFGMKAGMVPLHAWLPEAHPVAPSHISALMSGVMLKVALYGLIRFVFDLIGDVQWQWGLVMLVTGACTTLLGVLYAMVRNNLKRLLAYSSIENVGIILSALGLSLIFLGTGHKIIGVLGLIAALYHIIGHALFKGLLFLGAGAIAHSAHEYDLNNMGGLIRRMPQTALFMLIGCLAIAGLPPLTGFVSEWLTFQVALQAPRLESGVLRTLIPLTAAMLALSAALAAATFVKVYGIAFLGRARSRQVRHAREVGLGMRAAMALLAIGCIVFGILPSTIIDVLGCHPETIDRPGAGQRDRLGLVVADPDVRQNRFVFCAAGIDRPRRHRRPGLRVAPRPGHAHAPRISLGMRLRRGQHPHAVHRHRLLAAHPPHLRAGVGSSRADRREAPSRAAAAGAVHPPPVAGARQILVDSL